MFSFACKYFISIIVVYPNLCLGMNMSIYIGFANGVSHHNRNLALEAWIVYSLDDKLVSLVGFCIGLATNNVVEYHVVIGILTKDYSLGTSHMVVHLNSKLMVS